VIRVDCNIVERSYLLSLFPVTASAFPPPFVHNV
jgi:hypothetical protein